MKILLAALLTLLPVLAEADTPISQLTTGSPLQLTDMLPIARAGANFKLLGSDFLPLSGTIDPSGSCTLATQYVNTTSGGLFICYGNAWHSVGAITYPIKAPDGSFANPSYGFATGESRECFAMLRHST